MHNIQVMHGLESLDHLDKDAPNKVFFEAFILHIRLRYRRPLPLQTLHDLPIKVTHVYQFHDDAERFGLLVDEGFLVADDVCVVDGGEDADFVDGVLLLLIGQIFQGDHFECVELPIGDALHFEHFAVGAVAEVRDELKLIQITHLPQPTGILPIIRLARAANARGAIIVVV